jgi:hypothetical protein
MILQWVAVGLLLIFPKLATLAARVELRSTDG